MKTLTLNKINWLAGIIDGDGYLGLTKKGYASLEITMDQRDVRCLHEIKSHFGGSIKQGKGKWYRYRLHHKEGILNIIKYLNGKLRNPVRILQFARICEHYGHSLLDTPKLSYDNAWLSGFIDSDGSIYMNTTSRQIFITASQNNKLLLDPLVELYGGKIYTNSKLQSFKWTVFRKEEVLELTKYFKLNPLLSKKLVRINLIPKVYEGFNKSWHSKPEGSLEHKQWLYLLNKWNEYIW